MKYFYCCILLLLSFEIAFAQISPSDSKKISKILGQNFIELTPQKSYPYSSLNEHVIADTSLVVPDDTTGIYFNNEFLLFRSAMYDFSLHGETSLNAWISASEDLGLKLALDLSLALKVTYDEVLIKENVKVEPEEMTFSETMSIRKKINALYNEITNEAHIKNINGL